MAKHSRLKVYEDMESTGLVPVFYHDDVETAREVMSVCYEAGIKVFEFTNRKDGAHEVFYSLLELRNEKYKDLKLGIGSIMDAATAVFYIQLGADFIVSPILNEEIAQTCNRRKIAWIPGCGSVTEISNAEEMGAEIVKIFPGEQVGGPEFVKAIKGPCPWSSMMPTGGVKPNKDALEKWFNAGVVCVGMGSSLISKELLEARKFDKLKDNVKQALDIIKNLRA